MSMETRINLATSFMNGGGFNLDLGSETARYAWAAVGSMKMTALLMKLGAALHSFGGGSFWRKPRTRSWEAK